MIADWLTRTDVFHEVTTVTSGYRLALTYNLIFTGDTMSKPRAPGSDGPFATLERVLRYWVRLDEDGEGPGRLAYMLSHGYSQANLSFAHLKGADATLVNALQDLAEPLGFRIALGHLKCTRLGDAEGGGGWSGMVCRRHRCASFLRHTRYTTQFHGLLHLSHLFTLS